MVMQLENCIFKDTVMPAMENYHYNPTYKHLKLRSSQPKKLYM